MQLVNRSSPLSRNELLELPKTKAVPKHSSPIAIKKFPSNQKMASRQTLNKQVEQVARVLDNAGSIKTGLSICETNLQDETLSSNYKILFTTFKLLLQLQDGNKAEFAEIKNVFENEIYMTGDTNKLIKNVPSDSMTLNWIGKLSLQLMTYDQWYKIIELSNFKNRSLEKLTVSFNDFLGKASMKNLYQVTSILGNLTKNDPFHGRNFVFWNAVISLTATHLCARKGGNYENIVVSISPLSWLDIDHVIKKVETFKPFQSDQERIIYCQLCEVKGDAESKKKIVAEIQPQIALQNGNIDLYLKNLIINNCEDAVLLKKFCVKLLENLNDYDTLLTLINCCFKDLHLSKSETLEIINGNEKFLHSRNFKLGKLEVDLLFNENHAISKENLQNYLSDFHSKPCCFVDLQKFIKEDPSMMNKLEKLLEHEADEILNLNEQDPVFCYNMFKLFGCKEKYTKNLETYPEYVVDQVCAKFLSADENSGSSLISECVFSCFKLEKQLEVTPNEYILHLWLVVLYTSLGFLPLAQKHYYESLKIKNVQIDVLDHLIYSRHSSIWPVKDSIMSLPTSVYDSMDNMPRFIDIAFDRKSYSKIKGMFEFYGDLKMSFNRWRKYTDVLIASRLFNDTKLRKEFYNDLQELFEFNHNYNVVYQDRTDEKEFVLQFSDNRDFSTLFSSQQSLETLPCFMKYCNLDNPTYIQSVFAKELMLSGFQENTKKYDNFINCLLMKNGENQQSNLTKSLTKIEAWSFELHDLLYFSKDDLSKVVDDIIEKLKAPPSFDLDQQAASGWYYSHYFATIMTTLKTLDSLSKKLPTVLKQLVKSQLQYYRTQFVKSHFDHYMQEIENIKDLDAGFKQSIQDQVSKLYKTCKSL
ncbi:hypothetical protein ACO0QE_001436 [Hanseniaspora vineae]